MPALLNEHELHVQDLAHRIGPSAAFEQLIAENDALIRLPRLDHGREITTKRTAIYTGLVALWAEEQQRVKGYTPAFAVVALGGTGRGEVSPCSDLDFAFLFSEKVEGNAFFDHLMEQTSTSKAFEDAHGFRFGAFPFGESDVPDLVDKQLNNFLDMRAVYDPHGLADTLRKKIRAQFDAFEHFLHVRGSWSKHWDRVRNGSERVDKFDLKNDGLRIFLGGIWTLAAKDFRHSHEIYAELDDPRDLEAYEFLLRLRCWINLRRSPCGPADPLGNHREDVLTFPDFLSFGEMLGKEASDHERFEFANEVRARLLSARRRLASYSRGIIERELHMGRELAPGSPIVFGASGLHHQPLPPEATPEQRSHAALWLLRLAQHYAIPVSPSELQGTLCGAGDWLVRVPELGKLFQEARGSLADTFEFLSLVDGAMDRLFHGYGRFEASMEARLMKEQRLMRGALERNKMRALEGYVSAGNMRVASSISSTALANEQESARVALVTTSLDAEHLTAIKLALKTKRLPVTPADAAAREDSSLPWQDRYSSGFSDIPLADYFNGWDETAGFSSNTLEVTRFLIANRRAFKEMAMIGINPPEQVKAFAKRCGSSQRLRALFVFTYADRVHWESESTVSHRWWHSRELYSKALQVFHPELKTDPNDALRAEGFGGEELAVLRDFGHDFFSGMYRRHAARFGSHLLHLAGKNASDTAKAAIVVDGASTMLGVAARDRAGLAACISGALCAEGIELRLAHLFSAMNQRLVLDFFHLHSDSGTLPKDLARKVEQAILAQAHIAPGDAAKLPKLEGTYTLSEVRPRHCCLQFESPLQDRPGTVYALCYKVFHELHGNIHGLTAYGTSKSAFVVLYFDLPKERRIADAQRIVAGWK